MNCKGKSVHFADELADRAETVAGFLKGLANGHRMLILCALTSGERSVTAAHRRNRDRANLDVATPRKVA